jgi:hypothetical protein
VKVKFFLKRLALGFALAVGVYRGVDAAAPPPQVTPVFNTVAAPSQQHAAQYRLAALREPDAAAAKDLWRVRVGAWEIGLTGHHTFLEFSPYNDGDRSRVAQQEVYQIHGIACDEVRRSWGYINGSDIEAYKRYGNGDYVLKGMGVAFDHNRKYFAQTPVAYVDVFYGSKEEVLKMYLDGMQIIEQLNRDNPPYLLFDYNSNSTQRTISDTLGLPQPPLFVPYKLEAMGGRIWTPGTEKSFASKDWNRDKAREQGGYANLPADELEKRARALQGADRMFATFRELPALKPKGPG